MTALVASGVCLSLNVVIQTPSSPCFIFVEIGATDLTVPIGIEAFFLRGIVPQEDSTTL